MKEERTLKRPIIVNARFLTQSVTGVQRFAIEVSKRLKRMGVPLIFVSPEDIKNPGVAKELEVKIIGPFRGHLWEQVTLQLYTKLKGGTLVSFCNTAPLFIKDQIVTVHDLSFLRHPDWFSKRFSIVYSFLVPRIIKRAKRVLTVSEFSKKEIVDLIKVEESKIEVVYNGITGFTIQDEPLDSTEYGHLLKEAYILTVSSHHPRKNFKNLIKAFSLMENPSLKLYVIGDFNKNYSNVDIPNTWLKNVVFLENIGDQDLVRFYQNAKLFVYPSFYEGFGIPIIEAISMETMCAVSDIPVFTELFENSVHYFDPTSKESIANSIQYALSNPKSISELQEVRETILKKFSWDKSAKKVMEQFN
ncbi:hypothetical protein DN53_10970 [Flagellimonas olearia]|uniref:Glycosyltransferase n=1 Tax=Flagellimonas olearia TaxID=552546 RepID=A0A444VNK5_9FLAO|nr:hypothetical protein DN53_10970 [Allomuricauda olearia]